MHFLKLYFHLIESIAIAINTNRTLIICRVLTHECLAVLDELIRHGAISHMFTNDEQTTIANSVRSEVTAAGLTYSRDAAWNFFQSTVMKNLRIVLVCSETGEIMLQAR